MNKKLNILIKSQSDQRAHFYWSHVFSLCFLLLSVLTSRFCLTKAWFSLWSVEMCLRKHGCEVQCLDGHSKLLLCRTVGLLFNVSHLGGVCNCRWRNFQSSRSLLERFTIISHIVSLSLDERLDHYSSWLGLFAPQQSIISALHWMQKARNSTNKLSQDTN